MIPIRGLSISCTLTKNQLLVLLIFFSFFINLYFIYFLCDLYYFLLSVDFRFVRELIKGKKCLFSTYILYGLPGGSVVKNPLTNKGVVGLIPELGRSLEKEMATHSSILAWKIPWTEEPGGLQCMRLQESQR